MIKKIVFLIFVIAVALLIYNSLITKDYISVSVNISNDINELLVSRGVADRNIIKQYQREITEKNHRWVEFYKQLNIQFSDEWLNEITTIAQKHKCIVEKKISADGVEVAVSRDGRRFSVLVFLLKPARSRNKVAIVIDDLGYKKDIDEFLSLNIPLTYAILPCERYSLEMANKLNAANIDYLLHFPMEPEDPLVNPGRNAVLLNMSAAEIEKKFYANFKTVPGAFGVSNHMGSRFSRSAEHLKIFLSLVKANNLVYFDSYTTAKSQAKKVAQEIGLPVLVNEMFLDIDTSNEAIEKQIKMLLDKSKKQKVTIAIGHVHNSALPSLLKKYIPEFYANDIEFVSLKSLYSY